MTEVQKGGVEKTPQKDIKNDADRNRSISDHSFCQVKSNSGYDESIFGDLLQPGGFHAIAGDRGTGKTRMCVNLMYMLHTGYQECGDWEIITNVFMYHKDRNGTKVGTPDHVHHVDSIDELYLKLTELYGCGRQIAIVLDDIHNFYLDDGKGPITKQIRHLIANRGKLDILLILFSKDGFIEFENDRKSDYTCDCEWYRYDTEKTWESAKTENNLDPNWNRLDSSEVQLPDGEWLHVSLTVTDWTDEDKKEGWFYDAYTQSSILRYDKAFDFDSFWRGFGNTSSLKVKEYVQRFYEEHPKTFETEKNQMVKNYADIAAILKSMGLTYEAIEYALKTPKTTLRRWAEKQGYEWRKWSMDHPFRFKKIYGEKQDAGQAE